MDTGLFIIIILVIITIVHIFNKIMDYIIYQPRHIKKQINDDDWSDLSGK